MARGSRLQASLDHAKYDAAARAAAAKKAANVAAAAKAKARPRSAAEKKADKKRRQAAAEKEKILAAAQAVRKAKSLQREVGGGEGDVDMKDGADEADAFDMAAAVKIAFASDATIPIKGDDTVLLLGEANFSFAVALVSRGHSGHLICATAFDSQADTYEKYPDAEAHVELLRSKSVRVAFGVDAGALEKSRDVGKGKRWSRAIFNFPHVGKGITDQDRNVRANQEMLLRTFRSVANVLTEGPSAFPIVIQKKGKKGGANRKMPAVKKRPARAVTPDDDDEVAPSNPFDDDDDDAYKVSSASIVPASFTPPNREGSLCITLLSQSPYSLWDLKSLATRPPPVCPGTASAKCTKYRLLRSFEFVPDAWPGYAHRRTIGFKAGVSKAENEEIVGRIGKARTWEFAIAQEDDE